MSNPFDAMPESKKTVSSIKTYRKFIHQQLEGVEVMESVKIDVGSKNAVSARMNIFQFAAIMSRTFKTRISHDGELWVLRIL